MPYVPLDRFLVRAPLLPWMGGRDAERRLLREPLGKLALELASPSLAAAMAGERAERATDRYGRRAAFRPTPSGLLAGVALGELGARTQAATGQPRAHLDLTWGRVAALGRALLEAPAIRVQAQIRRAPSLLRGADRIRWLAFGADGAETRQAELDARLARILDASGAWTSWRAMRAAASGESADTTRGSPDDDGDDHDTDELLLLLIDDGLLHHDLAPSLIGPPAATWMPGRLAALRPVPPEAAALDQLCAALRGGDLDRARAQLHALPGGGDAATGAAPDVIGTLVHQPARPITLDRTVVERAARLAPLLFRLQEALTPPAAERLADGGARDALETARELFGEGSLDAAAWELGDYGIEAGAPPHAGEGDLRETDRPVSGPPPALVRLLVDEIAAARAEGRDEIALSAPALDQLLPAAAAPPTCELFLSPTATRAGWLLGLHAPAGASWGRFAGALGPKLADALAALAAAEKKERPDQRRLDVAYAPSEALADLCAHPPVRDGLLALSTWPAPAATPAPEGDVVTAAALGLLTTSGLDGPALTAGAGDRELVPSPLARVRSTTAPPGLFRLLAGFSLYRQHAPWALSLGPLADLAYLPRVSIDGFVIAPASWRIPGGLDARTFRRWRLGTGGAPPPPRFVQVGAADELLPVDLDHREARRDLAGQPRAWEIWPPLPPAPRTSAARTGARARARPVDRDGRRIEAVVALVDCPDEGDAHRIAARRLAIERAGAVPPPRLSPAAGRGAAGRRRAGGARGAGRRRDRPMVLPALRRRARAAPPPAPARARPRRCPRARRRLRRAAGGPAGRGAGVGRGRPRRARRVPSRNRPLRRR